MSKRTKVVIGVLVLVLVLGGAAMFFASSASAQDLNASTLPPTGGEGRTVRDARTVVGTYADGSPVYGSGTSADKSDRAVATRAAIAATKEGGS